MAESASVGIFLYPCTFPVFAYAKIRSPRTSSPRCFQEGNPDQHLRAIEQQQETQICRTEYKHALRSRAAAPHTVVQHHPIAAGLPYRHSCQWLPQLPGSGT